MSNKSHYTWVMATLNVSVGDINGNAEKILTAAKHAKTELGGDCLICPELALTGYPPEDLLLRKDFLQQTDEALVYLSQNLDDIALILGHPQSTSEGLVNAASLLRPKQKPVYYAKQYLPNYGVFDEKRYFVRGHAPGIFNLDGLKAGIMICEDLWHPEPSRYCQDAGVDCVIVINASPFDANKALQRQQLICQRAKTYRCPYLYVHLVGGQDELVFDGGSLAADANGQLCTAVEHFTEALTPITMIRPEKLSHPAQLEKPDQPITHIQTTDITAHRYNALVLGCRDYVRKNGYEKVIIGSSGGIDSALTAAIAVDALGKDNVLAVFMPSRFTSDLSRHCHEQLASALDIHSHTIILEQCFQSCLDTLLPFLSTAPLPEDVTEQNIQARLRAVLLMALANQQHRLLLATGNKSELAVGYATLYGDMAGGFAVLKDVYKTEVYALCQYRNTLSVVIPDAIIHRAPTAELAHNQKDTDTLPEYATLDAILMQYIEHDSSVTEMLHHGFNAHDVKRVIAMVNRNEYKRRQAPPGVRTTSRAFGRERRYPMTSGFKP